MFPGKATNYAESFLTAAWLSQAAPEGWPSLGGLGRGQAILMDLQAPNCYKETSITNPEPEGMIEGWRR
jgi:hypothetical protein